MKLSIIIPAHNEERTIAQVLRKVLEVELGGWDREVIVVDDGSSDGTAAVLEDLILRLPPASEFKGLKIIRHQKNLGKGAAIKSALKKAAGDYVIIQDADLEYFPEDIPKLLSALKNPHPPLSASGRPLPSAAAKAMADKEAEERDQCVFGDRGTARYPERGFHYVIGAKILTWSVNILYGARLNDLYTGYKLIPTAIIKSLNLESKGFEFEAEVACKILKAGYKITEAPINYQPRNKKQGKHIRLTDALKGFWTIIKYRLK